MTTLSRKIKDKEKIAGKMLYITRSKNLVDKSRELFYDYYPEDNKASNTEIEFLSIDEFLSKVLIDIEKEINTNIEGKKPIDKNRFLLLLDYIKLKNQQDYKSFKEYEDKENLLLSEFAIIAGSNKDDCLNEAAYTTIGDGNSKKKVYDLFKIYKKYIELSHEYYDINFIAHKCINDVKKIYSAVIIDEVQDLSMSILHLILGSLTEADKDQFMLCGDVNQVIYPGCFSMSALNQFLSANKYIYNNNIFYFLQEDYRNSEQVSELAQRLLHFKNYCCGVEDKWLPAKQYLVIKGISGNTGSVRFVTYPDNDIKNVIEKNAHFASADFAVLCSNEQDKKEFKNLCSNALGKKAVLTLTVHEAKGLEFDDIIIYNPISSNQDYYNNIYKSIKNINVSDIRKSCDNKKFKNGQPKNKQTRNDIANASDNLHGHQLNELFVQITRAHKSVTIIEKESSKKIFTKIQSIVEPENRSSLSIETNGKISSPQAWKDRILGLIDSGISNDIVEITKENLLDSDKEESIAYVTEIINALEAKGSSKEGKRLQGYLDKHKTATSDSAVVKIEAIDHPVTVSSSNVAQKSGVDNTTSVVTKGGDCEDIVEPLSNIGDKPSAQDEEGAHPLFVALEMGKEEQVESLLKNGADPNIKDKAGQTPLHVASERVNENIVKLLLEYKADPNIRAKGGIAPLHFASAKSNENIVELLLKNGADPNIENKSGQTPLYVASEKVNENIVKLLLEYKADPNIQTETGNTPLHFTSIMGFENIVKLLLEYQADPNIKNKAENTSLQLVSERVNENIVKLLLEYQADPNIRAEGGIVPLHIASQRDNEKIVELLLKNGANPNIQNEKGHTPLHTLHMHPLDIESQKNNEKILELLLKNGANPNIQNENRKTPLHLVSLENENEKSAELLLKHGANPNIQSKGGNSCLHSALLNPKNPNFVKLLLDYSANPNSKDETGASPLYCAYSQYYKFKKLEDIEPLNYLFGNPNANFSIEYKKDKIVYQTLQKTQIKIRKSIYNKKRVKIDKALFDTVQSAIERKNGIKKIEELLQGKEYFFPSFNYVDKKTKKTVIDLVTDKKDKDILQLLFSYMVEHKMPTDILNKLLVKDDKNNLRPLQ